MSHDRVHPRRVLLHETPDTQVWLDLDTGSELTLPRRKPTLTEAVEQLVKTTRIPFEWEDDTTVSVRLIGLVLTPRLTITALEDRRAIVFELDLQICVPDASRSAVLETLALLAPYANLPAVISRNAEGEAQWEFVRDGRSCEWNDARWVVVAGRWRPA